jgi:hypothetical protein
LGIGDWGLGIGPNPQSPIPNPQSPIPNPQSPIYFYIFISLDLNINQYNKDIIFINNKQIN